jgi:hypothetical protein
VPHVGGDPVDPALLHVEGERRVRAELVGAPERCPEPFLQVARPGAPPVASGTSERVQQGRPVDGRLVGVSLHLGEGDRPLGDRAVVPADRVPGVLPALVRQAVTAGVEVLEEAVPVGVSVVGQPPQRLLEVAQQRGDLAVGHARPPDVVEQIHPQRGGVDRAVVDRGEVEPALGVETLVRTPDLVQDLAGLLRGLLVDTDALPGRERAERALGDRAVHGQQHPRRDERVPSEHGVEPRRAGGQEHVVRPGAVRDAEAAEVRERPVRQPKEPTVGGGQHGRHQGRRGRPDDRRRGVGCPEPPSHRRLGLRGEVDVPSQHHVGLAHRNLSAVRAHRRGRVLVPPRPRGSTGPRRLDSGRFAVPHPVHGSRVEPEHELEGDGDRHTERRTQPQFLLDPVDTGQADLVHRHEWVDDVGRHRQDVDEGDLRG